MTPRDSSSHKTIALLIVFSLLQFYVVFALAAPTISNLTNVPKAPQGITGRLATRGNQNVLVNGNSARTGATVLSGATIETGDSVGATINLGRLGVVDVAPNTKALIEFSDGQIKVTIIQGCAIVRNKQGTYAQIYTDKGLAASNDQNLKPASTLDVCYPSGSPAPIINQGAAANAGAGAGGAVGTGVSTEVLTAIILGGVGAVGIPIALAHRGNNPSPSSP